MSDSQCVARNEASSRVEIVSVHRSLERLRRDKDTDTDPPGYPEVNVHFSANSDKYEDSSSHIQFQSTQASYTVLDTLFLTSYILRITAGNLRPVLLRSEAQWYAKRRYTKLRRIKSIFAFRSKLLHVTVSIAAPKLRNVHFSLHSCRLHF